MEEKINIIPSVIIGKYRLRALNNRLYTRPKNETFHEFLFNIVRWTFGKEWLQIQSTKPINEQHVVFSWLNDFEENKKNEVKNINQLKTNQIIEAEISGTVKALLQLGFDIYCLSSIGKFPEFAIKKLINDKEFQSIRYEIAIAAILVRAGFEIQWLDSIKQNFNQTHDEFKIIYDRFKIEMFVEVKSKRREGILNEDGTFSLENEERKLVGKLIQKAVKQGSSELPFLIFIDINLPNNKLKLIQKKDYLNKIVDEINYNLVENRDLFNVIIFTNYSYYYSRNSGKSTKSDYVIHISDNPQIDHPQNDIYSVILRSLDKYSAIPNEI